MSPVFMVNTNNNKQLMTNQHQCYYYYDDNDVKRGPVTLAGMQVLAERGLITPTSTIANSKGQTTLACNFELSFPESASEESVPFDVWLIKFAGSWFFTFLGVVLLLIIGNIAWTLCGVDGHSYLDAIFGKNSYVHVLFISGE